MRDRFRDLWDTLHSSFWFVPSLMTFVAAILSFVTIRIDEATSAAFVNSLGFIWSGGAEGARSILSTIAGSMITVAGVVFSIVIVALTLASSQFGPRLLRNFVRDTGNQVTLGTFIATFLYCILVLRTIRVKDEGNFIPYISITCGMALAIASIGVLIYFIHHVSVAIQAENVIARVGHELRVSIDNHFPERPVQEVEQRDNSVSQTHTVIAEKSGYVQTFDRSDLIELARTYQATCTVKKLPGDFIFTGDTLVQVHTSTDQPPSPKFLARMRRCFTLGDQRTESQDVRYGARQLSEIAARALSPGINDPYTAMGCIDWAAEALSRVAERWPAQCAYTDKSGAFRVVLDVPATFEVMCAVTLNPIIAYGSDNPIVACHLLLSLRRVTERIRTAEQAVTLAGFIGRIEALAGALLDDEHEKAALMRQSAGLKKELSLRKA